MLTPALRRRRDDQGRFRIERDTNACAVLPSLQWLAFVNRRRPTTASGDMGCHPSPARSGQAGGRRNAIRRAMGGARVVYVVELAMAALSSAAFVQPCGAHTHNLPAMSARSRGNARSTILE
jgi:hypothetical protein